MLYTQTINFQPLICSNQFKFNLDAKTINLYTLVINVELVIHKST